VQASQLLKELTEAVIAGDKTRAVALVNEGLGHGTEPMTLFDALSKGIAVVGERYQSGEFFIPDLVLGANAMKAGAELIGGEIARRQVVRRPLGKLLIGTVKTDLHDIGKNLVALLFQVGGFEVVDLGVDVPVQRFVEAVRAERPDIVGLSTLLTVGMQMQVETLRALNQAGLRQGVIVLVGGAPLNQRSADEIGADGYASNAVAAVALAKRLLLSGKGEARQ
jgi:5-methyltetrahydrofolate--homocysteine methyltransferase